jgi:lipopolysaccharide export system protein LptA
LKPSTLKIWRSSFKRRAPGLRWTSALLAGLLLAGATLVRADPREQANASNPSPPLHIKAAELQADYDAGWAEFRGSVRATRGHMVVLSDTLRIYFDKSRKTDDATSDPQASVTKIVAHGNVKITLDDSRGTADTATYDTRTQMLILSGQPSTFVRGDNSISGSEIKLHRPEGQLEVEGNAPSRVRAVVRSEGFVPQ